MIYKKDGTKVVEFDTYMEVSYDGENEIPSEPLENGRFSTDSKNIKPYTFKLLAIKSAGSNTPSEISNTITTLENLRNGTDILTVVSLYKTYSDINLVGLSHKQDSETQSLEAELSFKQLRINSTEYASTGKTIKPIKPQTKDRGIQQAKPVSETEKKKTSAIVGGARSASRFFKGK